MSRFTPRSAETIAAAVMARVRATTALRDMRANGAFAQLGKTFALQLARGELSVAWLEALFDIDALTGDALDARGEAILPEGIQRGGAERATGSLIFSRQSVAGDLAIPLGSRAMTTVNGRAVYYATTAAGSILAGNTDSAPIPAECCETGSIGNVDVAGAINQLGSDVTGVTSVANDTTFANGTDAQLDPAYREAMRGHVRGLGKTNEDGVLAAVRSAVSGTKTVRNAKIVDVPGTLDTTDVVIDDGFGTASASAAQAGGVLLAAAYGGEQFLLLPHKPCLTIPAINVAPAPPTAPVVIGPWGLVYFPTPLAAGDVVTFGAYTYYTGLVSEAQRKIDGDPVDRTTYPSVRVLGSVLRARPASAQTLVVSGTLVVADGYAPDSVAAAAKAALIGVVNRLDIGEPSYLAQRVAACMGVAGVANVALSGVDVYVPADVVLRTASANVTLTWGA